MSKSGLALRNVHMCAWVFAHGRPDEALGGGNQGPSAPGWARHDPMDCSPPGSSVHGILQAQGWAIRPEFSVLSLGLPAETRLLGRTAQTLRFFSRGVER